MAPPLVDLLGAQGGFVATSDVVNGLLGVLLLVMVLLLMEQLVIARCRTTRVQNHLRRDYVLPVQRGSSWIDS